MTKYVSLVSLLVVSVNDVALPHIVLNSLFFLQSKTFPAIFSSTKTQWDPFFFVHPFR